MKFENVPDLYFIVSVFVPGFIYQGVLTRFIPLREHRATELLLLRLFTATAFNYAVCSPLIYLLVTGQWISSSPLEQAVAWALIIFIAPIILALISAMVTQRDGLGWLYRWLRLRPISPIPTGWDWIFGRTEPCYLLVTLQDGTKIAGYFGLSSMASSDPERHDLYLEQVYTIPESGDWQPVHGSSGVYVDGSQIALIEFRN